MRIWRGIRTKQSRSVILEQPFAMLPSSGDWIPLILDKILKNLDDDGDERKLCSFSTSREIALRYAGNQGWLLEIEVQPTDVVFPQGLLESAKSNAKTGSEEASQLEEALEMTLQDNELFIKNCGHSPKIVNVFMVGSFEV